MGDMDLGPHSKPDAESGAPVAPGPGPDSFRGASRLERVILPFLREPTRWPVLLVGVAHAIAAIAPLLVLAWRDGSAAAVTGLVVLGALSLLAAGFEARDRRRPGPIAGLFAVTWVLSGLSAWAGARAGIL
jgi:hypothetical protein